MYIHTYALVDIGTIQLLCAKSRVVSLKLVTTLRLELCGALLLARLYREIIGTLDIKPSRIIFWCDSTIVLQWLKTPPHLLKTYVANCVATIQEITGSIEWRHVKSEDNPADAVSRNQLPHVFLKNQICSTGSPVKVWRDWIARRKTPVTGDSRHEEKHLSSSQH